MSLTAYERHKAAQELVTLTTQRTGRTPPDERVDGILGLLDDIPLPDLVRGMNQSARRDSYFPDPARIRKAAYADNAAQRSQPVSPEVAAAIASGERSCRLCEDTGWAWVDRAKGVVLPEPPVGSHALFSVRPCACRSSNPLYRAKRDREARNPRHEREDG